MSVPPSLPMWIWPARPAKRPLLPQAEKGRLTSARPPKIWASGDPRQAALWVVPASTRLPVEILTWFSHPSRRGFYGRPRPTAYPHGLTSFLRSGLCFDGEFCPDIHGLQPERRANPALRVGLASGNIRSVGQSHPFGGTKPYRSAPAAAPPELRAVPVWQSYNMHAYMHAYRPVTTRSVLLLYGDSPSVWVCAIEVGHEYRIQFWINSFRPIK
jgi:hypothetical protein